MIAIRSGLMALGTRPSRPQNRESRAQAGDISFPSDCMPIAKRSREASENSRRACTLSITRYIGRAARGRWRLTGICNQDRGELISFSILSIHTCDRSPGSVPLAGRLSYPRDPNPLIVWRRAGLASSAISTRCILGKSFTCRIGIIFGEALDKADRLASSNSEQ